MDDEVVRIPPYLIDWAIDAALGRIMLCSREEYPALELEESKGY